MKEPVIMPLSLSQPRIRCSLLPLIITFSAKPAQGNIEGKQATFVFSNET